MGIAAGIIGAVIAAGTSVYTSKKASDAQEKAAAQAKKDREAAEAKANQLNLNANKSDSELDEGDVEIGGATRVRKKRKGTSALVNSADKGGGSSTSGLVI